MDKQTRNLILLSDVHMGDAATMERNRYSRASKAHHLPELLDYYRQRRMSDRPWRLVIDGDFIDFVEAVELPDEQELAEMGIELTPDRKKFGLRTGPAESVWQLSRILSDNRDVMEALARFLMEGNDLFIISGNHDVQLIWPQVREAFKSALAGIVAGLGTQKQEAAALVQGSVHFNPWFYCEPGDLWVEHGNQFDPYNSFEYVLAPLRPGRDEVAPTVGTLAQRYFANRVKNLNPYANNIVGFFDYFKWAFKTFKWDAFKVLWYYFEATVRSMFMAGGLRGRDIYKKQLKEEYRFEQAAGISRLLLRRARRLHHHQAMNSLIKTASVVDFDKSLLLVAYLIGVSVAMGTSNTLFDRIALLFLAFTSFLGVISLLSRTTNRLSRQDFFKAGAGMGELLGVKNVVLGHIHEPYMGSSEFDVHVYGLGAWISNLGGLNRKLKDAVIPSFVIVTGSPGSRRVVMYSWDTKNGRAVAEREMPHMELLAM